MKKLIIAAIILIASCRSENYKAPEMCRKPKLLYKTEHCRVYCLEQNGYGRCLTVISECDSGYSMNVDVTN